MSDHVAESTDSTESTEAAEVNIELSQGIVEPTEAELMGIETDDQEVETTDEADTTVTTDAKEETETETDETKATEEVAASSEPKAKETPAGYVPLEAVHQARGEIKYLKEQLKDVQNQMSTLKTKPVETVVPDEFEVLSEGDFDILAEDDPAQAAIYLRNLNKHEASQRSAKDEERKQAEFNKEYDTIIDTAVAKIAEVAPGIYDEGSTVQKELMEFAGELGFSEDLYYLTNPSTKVILPGESEPLLLGDQAASILGMLVKAKTKTVVPDNTALETKLRTEITAELMAKFKNPAKEEYRPLSQTAKTDDSHPEGAFTGKVLTVDQLSKLSEAEQDAYLSGN